LDFLSTRDPAQRVARLCLAALAAQGVSHVTTQLVLMREMLAVYSGNELVVGVLLGCWLGLTGVGIALGRFAAAASKPERLVALAGLAVAVLPVGMVSALRVFRNEAFVRGAEIGLGATLGSSLVLLAPYCLVTGFAITAASLVAARAGSAPRGVSSVFVADGLGDVVGGALFGWALARIGDHYVTLVGVGAVVALGAAALAWAAGSRGLSTAGVLVAVALVALGSLVDLDRTTVAPLYPGREVLAHTSSLYGDLTVTRASGQIDWLENGVPVADTRDLERSEETVHFAMAQRPNAARVLLVGGAVSGTAEQVLGYPVERVDVLELDPELLALRARFAGSRLPRRVHWVRHDGRTFIRQTAERYDVLILDLPEPTTFQLNRYYTREFFSEAKRVLRPGGVVSFSIGPYGDYVSAALARQLAVARSTARAVFRNVLMIPTTRVLVVASDGELTLEIAERLHAHGIHTRWVNADMLAAVLEPDRLNEVNVAARRPAPPNTDFSPELQAATVRRWLGRFELPPVPVLVGGLALVLVLITLLGRVPVALATTGFAAAGLEVVLLIGLQIACGAVYSAASVLVTGYMLGSTAGAWGAMRWVARTARRVPRPKPSLALGMLVLAVGALALCCPVLVPWLVSTERAATEALVTFPCLGVLLGLLAGAAFPFAADAQATEAATRSSRLFVADMGGAALGALLVAVILVPSLGLRGASLAVGVLCWVGAAGVLLPFGRPGKVTS
jgi:spermidine synthase